MSDPLYPIEQFHVEKTEIEGIVVWVLRAEASSLGVAPGVYPQRFRVKGRRATVWFIYQLSIFLDGELVGWLYKASGGTKIPTYATIHND